MEMRNNDCVFSVSSPTNSATVSLIRLLWLEVLGREGVEGRGRKERGTDERGREGRVNGWKESEILGKEEQDEEGNRERAFFSSLKYSYANLSQMRTHNSNYNILHFKTRIPSPPFFLERAPIKTLFLASNIIQQIFKAKMQFSSTPGP